MIGRISYREAIKSLANVYEEEEFFDEDGNFICPKCSEPVYEENCPNFITVNGQILCPKCSEELLT